MVSQNKQLDVNVQNNEHVYTVQGEVNARYLTINFVENEIPFNLENSTVIIRCKDSVSNSEIFNSGEIIDELNGIATFKLTSAMSKNSGTFDLTFDIAQSNSESVLKVVGCQLVVLESASDVGVEGSNEFTALQQALFQTNEVLQTIQEQLITLNNSVSDANTSVEEINGKILEVNSLIVSVNTIMKDVESYYKGFNPATGEYTYITDMIQSLFQINLYSSAITCQEFDNLNLTCEQFDALGMTAYDFDFKSRIILMGNSGSTTPVEDINQLASDVGYIKSRIDMVETAFSSLSTLTNRVTTNENNISTLNTTTSDNTSSITSLTGRVTTNEGNISSLNTKNSTNETNISALQTTVGNKIDKISNGTVNNFVSIDSDGKLKDSGKVSSDYLLQTDLLTLIYPVGSIYLNTNNVNPTSFLGGTWEQIKDKFLLSAGDTYAAGSTGGEATHTLTIDEIPNHRHVGLYGNGGNEIDEMMWGSGGSKWLPSGTWEGSTGDYMTGYTGGGSAHNNMPPYIAVYMWKRTA